ncbi:hypothetical protein K08M3_50590 [Vibrio alginolyticus]|uniref:Uncharacterized protein n=1 Tax=Vibrio alginolyticus TaxID=663 RepID=A0A1W6UFP1_VIBAL|nr:hypothetical protein [Vibrio alginolyticus]ARP06569.1 hypothetical protein K04M1_50460 [Vibrio alginolyticus]ARP11702.1 hypothetical protein K04M3_51330 [Vibrio alginolyticus]ARP16755.1 hypothetical protein K04M5_51030 [Vibrio alginolyticus]ARP21792.1 hypothetical protein K05K4_50900 [Vibrio alginolyticus]ARP26855.1 hypothetical protein K06K5_50550 [Vibrio alginolyticus]
MYQNLKKMLIDTDNRLMILLLAVTLIVIGAILLAFGVEKIMSMSLSLSGSILAFSVLAFSFIKSHKNDKEFNSGVCKIPKDFEEKLNQK